MTLFDASSTEAANHMRRGLAIVDILSALFDDWNRECDSLTSGSAIANLDAGIAPASVTPLASIHTGLRVSYQCLYQVKDLVEYGKLSSSVVVRGCLRAAMLGAAHVVYVLAPEDGELRLERANKIAQQEAHNLRAALNEFETFTALQMGPPSGDQEKLMRAATFTLQGAPVSDRTILRTVAIETEQRVASKIPDIPTGVLSEHLEWMWRSYSGIVHGLAWTDFLPQHRVSGEAPGAGPGDLIADFVQVASLAQDAFTLAIARTRDDPH